MSDTTTNAVEIVEGVEETAGLYTEPYDSIPDEWSMEIETCDEYSQSDLANKYGNSICIKFDENSIITDIFCTELNGYDFYNGILTNNVVPAGYAIVYRCTKSAGITAPGFDVRWPNAYNSEGEGVFLKKGLYDRDRFENSGYKVFNYKFVDNQIVERTDEEKANDTGYADALITIANCRANLTKTDYVTIKIAEGKATTEEYEDVLNQRDEWRATINELQEKYGIVN